MLIEYNKETGLLLSVTIVTTENISEDEKLSTLASLHFVEVPSGNAACYVLDPLQSASIFDAHIAGQDVEISVDFNGSFVSANILPLSETDVAT